MFGIKFSCKGPCMFQHLKISFSKGNFNEKTKALCYGCKSSIKDIFSKCDQVRKLRICSYLLKKSLMETFIFWTRLRPCHISVMKLLCGSCQWLLAVNYFDKKGSIIQIDGVLQHTALLVIIKYIYAVHSFVLYGIYV